MIHEVKMYTVLCDNCLKDYNKGSDIVAWTGKDESEDMALESGWIKQNNKHYCNDCYTLGLNDEIILLIEKCDAP